MKIQHLAAFVVTMFVANASFANTTPGENPPGDDTRKTDLLGGVTHADTRKPLAQVNVVAYMSNKREAVAITDNQGQYYFNDLKPGVYKLVFEKDGFNKVIREKVTIRANDGSQLNIQMEEEDEFRILPGLLLDFED